MGGSRVLVTAIADFYGISPDWFNQGVDGDGDDARRSRVWCLRGGDGARRARTRGDGSALSWRIENIVALERLLLARAAAGRRRYK